MTKELYEKYTSAYVGKHAATKKYEPKHEKKWYYVYRVLSAAGPQENISVYGLDEAREAISGCWDWEVTTSGGKIVNV